MNLRKLLTQEVQRRVKLVEVLYVSSNGLTLDQVKKINGCSLSTLQQDIEFINAHYQPFTIEVEEKLYKLMHQNSQGLDILYKKVLDSSLEFQLLELLLFEQYETISDLAEYLYTSVSSVFRMIKKIEETIKPLNMKIAKRPLRIIGNEAIIRHFFGLFFREKKFSFTRLAHCLKTELAVREIINDFMIENQFYEAYITHIRVEYNFCISLIRVTNGHFLPNEEILSPAVITPDFRKNQNAVELIEKYFDVQFDFRLYRECFWLFYGDFLILNMTQRDIALANNPLLAELYQISDDYLKFLEHELNFLFENDQGRYENLKATLKIFLNDEAYLYQYSNDFISIIEEDRKDFINEYSKIYGYQIDILKKLIWRFAKHALPHVPVTEDRVINQLYILIIHFPQILEKISNCGNKINILILSLVYPMQESFLAYTLSKVLKGPIEYHFINHMSEYLKDKKMKEKIDLIISTSSIDERFQGVPFFIIEPYPTLESFKSLQIRINKILEEKHQIRH